MKYYIILTLISILLLPPQSNNKISDIRHLTNGKWHLDYIEMSNQKLPLPQDMKDNTYVIFFSDGKHEYFEMGSKRIGTWEYIEKSRSIKTLDKDGEIIQHILTLDKANLALKVDEQGQEMVMGMSKRKL